MDTSAAASAMGGRGTELEASRFSNSAELACGAPMIPGGSPWIASAPAVATACSSSSSPKHPCDDAPPEAFLPVASGQWATSSALVEGTASGEPLLSGGSCPSTGAPRDFRTSLGSHDEMNMPPSVQGSLFTEAPQKILVTGSASSLQAPQTEKQMAPDGACAGTSLSQRGIKGGMPDEQGLPAAADGDGIFVAASNLNERQGCTPTCVCTEALPSLDEHRGPPQLCGAGLSKQLPVDANNNQHDAISLTSHVPAAEESPCEKQSGLAVGPMGDPTASAPKWLSGHTDMPTGACASELNAATAATVQGLHIQEGGSREGSTSSRAEGTSALDQGSCLLPMDSVKHECSLTDSGAHLIAGAGGEGAGVGVAGSSYKRKPGGTCCLPAPTQQRLVGLQPRPPPPRVYHVVMCTRRYWRVEWVSPETGRRVYKHFGENRYGGGDRAREVAVKFWAEVRKRSADGVERGEWQGLTEVTRRVREEGVEGILEEVRATPSPGTGAQTVAALTVSDGTVADETSLARQPAASIEHPHQQHQQGCQLDTSPGLGEAAAGAFSTFATQQQSNSGAAADGYRQRAASLRTTTRGRLLRESSKESTATNSSRPPPAHAKQEENPMLAEGSATPAGIHGTGEEEEGECQNLQQQQHQQQSGSEAFTPLRGFGDASVVNSYSGQQQQVEDGGPHNCIMPIQRPPFQQGLDGQGDVSQLGDPALSHGAPILNGNPGLEALTTGGPGTAEWRAQPMSQTSVTPPLPLYDPALGATQGVGRLCGSGGDLSGNPEMGEDHSTAKNGGDLLLKREGTSGTCSSIGEAEPAAKRYRTEGLDSSLSDSAPWIPSQLAYPGHGGSTSSSGVGNLPLVHPGPCGISFGALGQSPMTPMEFPGSAGDPSTALSLPTGVEHILPPEATRARWTNCSGDIPASLASVHSPPAFQDMRGTGGPQIPQDFTAANTTVGPGGIVYASSSQFPQCEPQVGMQQHQMLQQAHPSLEGFPLNCQGDSAYRQQQPHPGVQTPGMRTPPAGSAVSSSRRSRYGVSGSTRKGQSGGNSGRSGSGGGSHGTRTIGRIYSLLVRGVRCWRAEWHDRASGHRKTRQYAAPKHGEQQARALCLQALCQARSVPAQLLREAQQTFAYEPTVSPEQNSEPEEAPTEGLPSTTPYPQQPQQQGQFLQPTSVDQGAQLQQTPFPRGDNCTNAGYTQAGYYWPITGVPTFNSLGGTAPILDPTGQQSYGNNGEQLQQQAGMYDTALGMPLESGPPGAPASDAPPSLPASGCSVFPPNKSSTTVYGGNGYGDNASNEATAISGNGFVARSNQECTALKQEHPESALNPFPLLGSGPTPTADQGHPQQLCGFPASAPPPALITKGENPVCGNPRPPVDSGKGDGERPNPWDSSFLASQ